MGEALHMSVPDEPTAYSKTGVEVQPDTIEAAALAAATVEGQHPVPLFEAVSFGGAEHSPN
jgi:hypothetical protein